MRIEIIPRLEQLARLALRVGLVALEQELGGGVHAAQDARRGSRPHQQAEFPLLGHLRKGGHAAEHGELGGEVLLQGGAVAPVEPALVDEGVGALHHLPQFGELGAQALVDAVIDLPHQLLGHGRDGPLARLEREHTNGGPGADHQAREADDQQPAQRDVIHGLWFPSSLSDFLGVARGGSRPVDALTTIRPARRQFGVRGSERGSP